MATTFTYAEELTLSNLRSATLRKLRVEDTIRYAPSGASATYTWIDASLNKGLKTFVRKTKCLRGYAVYVPIAAYQYYRLPEGYIDLESAYYYNASLSDGYRKLIPKTIHELDDELSDWRTDTGEPKYIVLDRMFGRRWFFGLVPIPDTAGTTVTWDTTYGTELTDICSLTTYNEEFVELPQSGKFFCPNSSDSPGKPFNNINLDILIIYYRLPRLLDTSSQYPEMPREYHESLADYAAFELLQDNPQDSAEYKRSMNYYGRFEAAIKEYTESGRRKVWAKSKRAMAGVWTWLDGMDWHTEQGG